MPSAASRPGAAGRGNPPSWAGLRTPGAILGLNHLLAGARGRGGRSERAPGLGLGPSARLFAVLEHGSSRSATCLWESSSSLLQPREGGYEKTVMESQLGSSLPCSLVKTPQHSRTPSPVTPLAGKRKPPRGGSRGVRGCWCRHCLHQGPRSVRRSLGASLQERAPCSDALARPKFSSPRQKLHLPTSIHFITASFHNRQQHGFLLGCGRAPN